MTEFNCVIIDDQEKAREMLQMHLASQCPNVVVKEKFDNPQSGAAFVNANNIHIVFLDIEMGNSTGFDLFDTIKLNQGLPLIIFVTAHTGYAIEAIKADAFDYILKPINPTELSNTVTKAKDQIEEIIFQQKIQSNFFSEASDHNQLKVLVSGGVEFIKKRDIIYLKAARNYTEIYLKGGRQILASKTLSHFDKSLSDHSFVRSHRSYLVNLLEIRAFRTADGGYLEMTENHRANITSANKDILMERMAEL